jgi:hypothetical protein
MGEGVSDWEWLLGEQLGLPLGPDQLEVWCAAGDSRLMHHDLRVALACELKMQEAPMPVVYQ